MAHVDSHGRVSEDFLRVLVARHQERIGHAREWEVPKRFAPAIGCAPTAQPFPRDPVGEKRFQYSLGDEHRPPARYSLVIEGITPLQIRLAGVIHRSHELRRHALPQ